MLHCIMKSPFPFFVEWPKHCSIASNLLSPILDRTFKVCGDSSMATQAAEVPNAPTKVYYLVGSTGRTVITIADSIVLVCETFLLVWTVLSPDTGGVSWRTVALSLVVIIG